MKSPCSWSAPPNQQLDIPRLQEFLPLFSSGHRWVMEFRHPSWHTNEVYRLLAAHEVALCIPVGGGLEPDRITTAAFTYLRMHRGNEPRGGFTADELKRWTARLRALSSVGKGGYIYFNNDWEGFAVRDATTLRELLGSSADGYSTQ